MFKNHQPLIITGPTASGKSSYALKIARQENGKIINADSMQIYKELPLLTAQPTEEEKQSIPHALYSFLKGNEPFSVALWHEHALKEIEQCQREGYRPIIVGGTGMYLSSLTKGISPIPDIKPEIREEARTLFQKIGAEKFHEHLKKVDPLMAARLKVNDQQRIIRAYEVKQSTGLTLDYWQKQPKGITVDCEMRVISRPREELHRRAKVRFERMLGLGVLKEVEALLDHNYPPDFPVMKALGVQELAQHLKGYLSLKEACEKTLIATRQYIKRQQTWIRHQFPEADI